MQKEKMRIEKNLEESTEDEDGDNKMNIFKKRLVVDSSDESDNRLKKQNKICKPKKSASKIGLESSDDDYNLSKVKSDLDRPSSKKPVYTDSDSDMEENKYNKSSAVAAAFKGQK